MGYKILIVFFSWLATIGSLFLFASSPPKEPALEAKIVNTAPVFPVPTPSSTLQTFLKTKAGPPSSVKTSPLPSRLISPSPTFSPLPHLSPTLSPFPVILSPSPLPSLAPTLPTISLPFTFTPSPSTVSTPFFTPTVSPTISSDASPPPTSPPTPAHIFYTSAHWKAKYYYCDTDNNWKDLSLTYLKSFSSEQELLANYSRVLHEPCKD